MQIPIENFGPVKGIALPDNWVQTEPEDADNLLKTARVYEFKNTDCEAARFCLFQKGLQVSPDGCQAFEDVLAKGGTVPTSSFLPLMEVLGNQAFSDYFEVSFAKVETLNGKKGLILEGTWPASQSKTISFFVLDSKQRLGYEIYLQAPIEVFENQATLAAMALNSVQWK